MKTNIQLLNSDINKFLKIRKQCLKINKKLKHNTLCKFKKNFKMDSVFMLDNTVHKLEIESVTEEYKEVIYTVKSKYGDWSYEQCIPKKYKKFTPVPIIIKTGSTKVDEFFRGPHDLFLLSNFKIYAGKGVYYRDKPVLYDNLKEYIQDEFKLRERYDSLDYPVLCCDFCKLQKSKNNKIESFYDILSYNIAKYKGLNMYCCDKTKREYSIRLIQKKVLCWLYSAPNGPMFKKSVKELQEDGYLTI